MQFLPEFDLLGQPFDARGDTFGNAPVEPKTAKLKHDGGIAGRLRGLPLVPALPERVIAGLEVQKTGNLV